MATIINPTPVTASTFGGMWVKSLTIIRRTGQNILMAELLPYDGSHLLATGGKRVFIKDLATDTSPALTLLLTALDTEIARLSPDKPTASIISVSAQDPTKPVRVNVMFPTDPVTSLNIPDAYAKAGEDATFAVSFTTALGAVAALAGLSVGN